MLGTILVNSIAFLFGALVVITIWAMGRVE